MTAHALLCPGPSLPGMLFLSAAALALAVAGGVVVGWIVWQLVRLVRGSRPIKLK